MAESNDPGSERTHCDSCDFQITELFKTTGLTKENERFDVHLCKVCFQTYLARPTMYPNARYYQEHEPLFKSIAYLGNMILKAIKEQQNGNGQRD